MKVFISWSGNLSHRLAEAFHTWLPGTLQAVKPYFTPSDIEKGTRWNAEVSKELEASDVGVLFITRENIGNAWPIFEAGALSKKLEKSKVCPIIFNMSPSDLPGPLGQFQSNEFKKGDFKKLLKTINASAGEHKLRESVLNEVFETWWPRLEEKFTNILEQEETPDSSAPLRSDREILEEILELSRTSAKRFVRTKIPQKIVPQLVNSVRAARDAIQGTTDHQAAMDALASMCKPIGYLMTYAIADSNLSEELIRDLEGLSFEYEPPEEDDDIPF